MDKKRSTSTASSAITVPSEIGAEAVLSGQNVRARSTWWPSSRVSPVDVLIGLTILFYIVVLVDPGLIAPGSPTAIAGVPLAPPSLANWAGTDQLGRSVFDRLVWGARPVLLASAAGMCISMAIGVTLGVIGAMGGRVISVVAMRVLDILLALPILLIALMVIAILGPGIQSVVIALGVAFIPAFARVVYSSVRTLRRADYVSASRAMGATLPYIMVRHLIPNLATEVLVIASSAFGWAILTATTLSFLGFGVKLPSPDWGIDLAGGEPYLSTAWWISTFPGLAITATILFSNFLGDYLARRLDPQGQVRAIGTVGDPGVAARAIEE